jgi:beta-galactosidase
MKSFFLPEEPLVHIAVIDKKGDQMWNGVQTGNDGMSDHWVRMQGQQLSLYTYSNAEEVELVLNGKSLGKKQNPVGDPKHRNQIKWDGIGYQPGYLEAVARTGGKVVARHRIETTGPAVRLKAEADLTPKSPSHSPQWKADGLDLQHVRIEAVDSKGRCVQTSDNEISFSVEGPAEIVGVINGDINSDELTVGNRRSLYNGTCTVILRSQRQAGKVTLKATGQGLKPVSLMMTATMP